MKKIILHILIISTILFAIPVNAQDIDPERNELDCGNAFLQMAKIRAPFRNMSSFDDYFTDLFKRNFCQYSDIEDVRGEIINQRLLLKQHFLECAPDSTIEKDRTRMYELEVELYYLRNFIDTTKDIPQQNVSIHQDVIDRFSSELNLMPEDVLESMYKGIEQRYQDRQKKYRDCKEDLNWQDVKKKIKKLTETMVVFQGIRDEWKRREDRTSPNEQKEDEPGEKQSFWQGLKNHAKKMVAARVNKVSPKKAFSDLKKALEKEIPKVTFSDALDLIGQEEFRVASFTNLEERKAKYQSMYGQVGDKVSDEMLQKLHATNQVIQDTYTNVLPLLLQCVSTVNSKQCQ